MKIILLRATRFGGQEGFVTQHKEIGALLHLLQIPAFVKPATIKTNSAPGTFQVDPKHLEHLATAC